MPMLSLRRLRHYAAAACLFRFSIFFAAFIFFFIRRYFFSPPGYAFAIFFAVVCCMICHAFFIDLVITLSPLLFMPPFSPLRCISAPLLLRFVTPCTLIDFAIFITPPLSFFFRAFRMLIDYAITLFSPPLMFHAADAP